MCFYRPGCLDTWVHGQHTVRYIHLRAVDGVMQRLCFPFAACHFCLPTITLIQSQCGYFLFYFIFLSSKIRISIVRLQMGVNSEVGHSLMMCILFLPKVSQCLIGQKKKKKKPLFHSNFPHVLIHSSFRSVLLLLLFLLLLLSLLFTPSQNRELEEKGLSWVQKKEIIGMEDAACLLSHGRIETPNLKPEAPPCLM